MPEGRTQRAKRLDEATSEAKIKIDGDETRNPGMIAATLTPLNPVILREKVAEVLNTGNFGEHPVRYREIHNEAEGGVRSGG